MQYFVSIRSKGDMRFDGYFAFNCSAYKVVKEIINFAEALPFESHIVIKYLKNGRNKTLLKFDTDKADKRNFYELANGE